MKMNPFGSLITPLDARLRAERAEKARVSESKPEREKPARQAPANPWGLTSGQCEALDALCKAGSDELAGELLGLNSKTIAGQVSRAKSRMGIDQRLLLILTWDRWVRAHQEINQ